MPFSDVPDRLLAGDAVPRSEIIGYLPEYPDLETDLHLDYMCLAGVLIKVYEDDTLKFQITPFGQTVRQDFVKRIEGDCPDCPDCP